MKVVILAGGFGTRLAEFTDSIPKPMVPIGGLPILIHIMKIYSHYGYNDFVIAMGYKSEVIKKFFKDKNYKNWNITLVDTGEKTMTGGRLKRLKKYLGNSTFFLTYGDGVGDIDIKLLLKFHKKNNKIMTVTGVKPPARFGELKLDGDNVTSFDEKPQMQMGWINGGFFVIEPQFIDFIKDDTIMLEREPMSQILELKELVAYRHNSFWQCMDTKREYDTLNELWMSQKAKWLLDN